MYSIFTVPWEGAALEHLRTFLSSADEEGVTWEAKAEEPTGRRGEPNRLHPSKIVRAVCGLANQIGGYVVIGARKGASGWELPGIAAPSIEPGLWLDQILDGLQPDPRIAHKHWFVGDDRLVAVVRVEPLAQTPCMTRDGQIFERVSSETIKVTDPARLNELIQRGEKARAAAEAGAHVAATELFEHPGVSIDRSVWIGVGLAAGSYEADIAARLFHSRFPAALERGFVQRLCTEAGLAPPQTTEPIMRQSFVALDGGNDLHYGVVSAHWSGRVGVLAALAGDMVLHQSLFDSFVIPAWTLAADLVAHLGGYGDARMELAVRRQTKDVTVERQAGLRRPGPVPPPSTLYGKLPHQTNIPRATEVRAPQSEEIGSIQRELQRAAGLFSFEGQPDPPDLEPAP